MRVVPKRPVRYSVQSYVRAASAYERSTPVPGSFCSMSTALGGAPISEETRAEIASARSSMMSATRSRTAARSAAGFCDQTPDSKAARAVRTAVSTSTSSASGTEATRSPVAGENTSRISVEWGATHVPPM